MNPMLGKMCKASFSSFLHPYLTTPNHFIKHENYASYHQE